MRRREPGRLPALLGAAALGVLLFLGAGPLPPDVDRAEFERAARVILCDCGCHPQSVYDCACGRAAEMREEIAAEIRNGRTGDQVVADYVARHGEKILIAPKASGFNLLAWIGPGFALVAGAAGLFLAIRRWARQGAAGAARDTTPAVAADDPYLARLERHLREER